MWPKDNPESWQRIHEFIDEFPDDAHWSKWKPMVRDIIAALEGCGLVPLFRIGQSMHDIILSTSDHHILISEPRVTLRFEPQAQTVWIAYSRANVGFNEPLSEEEVPMDAAIGSTLSNLRRLWIETKPGIPVPDALNAP